eukprot:scaffold154205_cov31-Tisochrysis_lutea.AAC.1
MEADEPKDVPEVDEPRMGPEVNEPEDAPEVDEPEWALRQMSQRMRQRLMSPGMYLRQLSQRMCKRLRLSPKHAPEAVDPENVPEGIVQSEVFVWFGARL